MHKAAVLIVAIVLSGAEARACSLAFEPLSRPSAKELVLTATVVSVSDGKETAVLRLRDIQPIWPRAALKSLDVAIYDLTTMCEPRRIAAAELFAQFPTRSRVSVVAEPHRPHFSRRLSYDVYRGGNSSVDLSSEPSERFVLRSKLAELETVRDNNERLAIVRSLIPDRTGEVDLPGVFERYIADAGARREIASECAGYWSERGDSVRCRAPN